MTRERPKRTVKRVNIKKNSKSKKITNIDHKKYCLFDIKNKEYVTFYGIAKILGYSPRHRDFTKYIIISTDKKELEKIISDHKVKYWEIKECEIDIKMS